jgi:ribonuclease HII
MSHKQQADLSLERAIAQEQAITFIAGLDEAGRGALAGPVAAAAVILPLADPERLMQLAPVNDSKQLSAKKRALYYDIIVENALAYGIGSASAIRIDKEGIIAATKHAMTEALRHIGQRVEFLLIDGRIQLKDVPIAQQSIVRGDSRSLSIAAASILAKVTRDRYMIALDPLYPQYGFGRHKGYATAQHLAAIQTHGPIALHRHTFAPVRQKLL